MIREIQTAADLEEGAQWLALADPRLAPALAECAPLPLRRRAEGFGALLWIVTGQLVSTAAAAAVWSRLEAAGYAERAAAAKAGEADLTRLGLSRAKARAAIAIAQSDFDFSALQGMSDVGALAALRALPGVGPWTADLYALSAMGRADVFPQGDLALQEAARRLLHLPARPSAREMAAIAAPWSPWRAVAARLLWAYYRRQTGRGA